MKTHKIISTILHPIIMPVFGILLYFVLIPINFNKTIKYSLFSIIFITTFVIPILILFLLKAVKYIKNYNLQTIEERKFPVFFMISLFFVLGKIFYNNPITRDLSYLFFGTSMSLIITYILFFTKTKTSLHLLSMGNMIGFFLVFQELYNKPILIIISILILLSGLLGVSRLHLKCHNSKEIYLGFFIGILSQLIIYLYLQ